MLKARAFSLENEEPKPSALDSQNNSNQESVPQPDATTLRRNVETIAKELGFADCKVAPAAPARHREEYSRWVEEERYGDMEWMARNVERRSDPREVLPGAKSVIVLALNYFQGSEQPKPKSGKQGIIARYAWGDDYHDLVTPRLKDLNAYLEDIGGKQRYYVDTGPVLERDFASESGLGWNGKSTVQIHRKLGTWFFLADIITTLEIEPDSPEKDRCGSCTRCITACPTDAITSPHQLDARRCISYLTIEHKGSIPEEFRRAMGDRIYGCDDCLEVCPWNRFAVVSREATLHAREAMFELSLTDYLKLSDEEFRELFRGSPIKRSKRPRILRNVCVALGNIGTEQDLPALEEAAKDPDPLISEHAQWAICEIKQRLKLPENDGAPFSNQCGNSDSVRP